MGHRDTPCVIDAIFTVLLAILCCQFKARYTTDMKITLLSVGKTRSRECAALEDEYAKRIRGRFSFERNYVKNNPELIRTAQSASGKLVLLDENGTTMTSYEFAQYIDKAVNESQDITFVIGDAPGLPTELRDTAEHIVSLSEMTFPHEIARVMCIEQLYRAQTILAGHPYHK